MSPSALADALPGVAFARMSRCCTDRSPLTLPGLLARTIVAAHVDMQAGRRQAPRNAPARRLLDLVTPAKSFGEPHDLLFPKLQNKSTGSFSSCELAGLHARRVGQNPQSRICESESRISNRIRRLACSQLQSALMRGSTRRALVPAARRGAAGRSAAASAARVVELLAAGADEDQAQQRDQQQRAERDRPGAHRRFGEIAEEIAVERPSRLFRHTARAARRRQRISVAGSTNTPTASQMLAKISSKRSAPAASLLPDESPFSRHPCGLAGALGEQVGS